MPEIMTAGSAVEELSTILKPIGLCERNLIDNDTDVDEVTKKQKMCELRKLIEECKNLQVRTDDAFMSRFLYSTDWDVPKAFTRLEKLFKLRHEHPEFFITKPLEHYRHLTLSKSKVHLHKLDKHGRRIFVTKFAHIDPSVLSLQDMTALDDLWFEVMFDDVATQRDGMVAIIDAQGYSWRMMRWLTPGNMKVCSQRADLVPARRYEFHVVNSSVFMNSAIQIVFPSLSKDIKNAIHFHSNYSTLHAYLGKESVPTEYGGDLVLDYDKSLEILEENFNLINDLHKYDYIETEGDTKSNKKNKKK